MTRPALTIVHNSRGVTVEAAGHLFPPRSTVVLALDAEQLAELRSRPGFEIAEPLIRPVVPAPRPKEA